MLYYERIDISEASQECMTCHYWFFNHEFKFQHSICNGCYDVK